MPLKDYSDWDYGSNQNESAEDWFNRINKKNSLADQLESAETNKNNNSLTGEQAQGIARGAIQGGKSGLSGALMGGGLAAGLGSIGAAAGSGAALAGPYGWAALAGGALLSELESQNEAEAMQEQANVNAEIDRRSNVQKAGNSLLAMFNSFGNMKA
jgi:hypothetical protein